MERYNIPETPLESRRSDASPHFRFRTGFSFSPHEWHITRVALILMRDVNGGTERFNGVIQLDPQDRAIVDGLKILMTRDEEIAPGHEEETLGLGQILSEVMYILAYNWGIFVKEAESHIQILVSEHQSRVHPESIEPKLKHLHRARNVWSRTCHQHFSSNTPVSCIR